MQNSLVFAAPPCCQAFHRLDQAMGKNPCLLCIQLLCCSCSTSFQTVSSLRLVPQALRPLSQQSYLLHCCWHLCFPRAARSAARSLSFCSACFIIFSATSHASSLPRSTTFFLSS